MRAGRFVASGRRLRPVRLHSTIRPDPDTGERREIYAEAPTWEAATAQLDEQRPEGWREIHITVVPSDASD